MIFIRYDIQLTEDDIKAMRKAYLDLEGKDMTDDQFEKQIGKYSQSAMEKIIKLQERYDRMTANLDEATQEALETMQDIGSNTEEEPSAKDVCDWILNSSSKIRKLTAKEQAQIVKDLPNLGKIMTQTNYLKVQSCPEVDLLILDILNKFGE
uniref:Phage protein n=1 Tax=Steinernema glaseri TaxID=37863 RepID=A0A1I7XZ72_9BILA